MAKKIKIILGIDDIGVITDTVNAASAGTDILIITHRDPAGIVPRYDKPGIFMFYDTPVPKIVEMLQGLAWAITTANCNIIRNSDHAYYQEILDTFEPELNCFRLNMFTTMTNNETVQRNAFLNISRYSRCAAVKNLQHQFRGSAAICVAAGPSLDDDIAELHGVRDEFLIIACDTALRPLAAAGIRPDIVCALDYSELNLQKIEGVPLRSPLVALPAVQPQMIDSFLEAGQDVFISYRPDSFYEWMDKNVAIMGSLPFLGCVAVMAFELAIYMGADRIALLGYDFGYPNEQSHAKNSMHDDTEQSIDFKLPSVGGGLLKSNLMFAGILNEFQKRVSNNKPHVKAIMNTSRAGAMIQDTTCVQGLAGALESLRLSDTYKTVMYDMVICHAASGKAVPGSMHQVVSDFEAVRDMAKNAQRYPELAKDIYNTMISMKNTLELIDIYLVPKAIPIEGGSVPGDKAANYFKEIESACEFYLGIIE